MTNQSSETASKTTPKTNPAFNMFWVCLFVLFGLNILVSAIVPSDNSGYASVRSLWYADFRYWPDWVSACCWLSSGWMFITFLIRIFVPQNDQALFFKRRTFYLKSVNILFVIVICSVWYRFAELPLSFVFAPLTTPFTSYVHVNYIFPLADYYTTGEGSSPAAWPIFYVILLAVILIAGRVGYFFLRRKRSKTVAAAVCILLGISPISLQADVYDVQSKEDIYKISPEDVHKLVKSETERNLRVTHTPHKIVQYCFDEGSFQYTGGKYEDSEIKYRLHTPRQIVPGKKYPLAVHLHGVGESGSDNLNSLIHLHSLLPIFIGPEQQDFFLLVIQCPADNTAWTFKKTKDGNLDVLLAGIEHIMKNYSIDSNRLSAFGLSSGGYGVWELITGKPDMFAAAVPTDSSVSSRRLNTIGKLDQTSVWAFVNEEDKAVNVAPLVQAERLIHDSNGSMTLTRIDQEGHAAWRSAMYTYNCFSWMIAQERGAMFNPPPERRIFRGRTGGNSFTAFFFPLGLAVMLFFFQNSQYCVRLHQRIALKFYPQRSAPLPDNNEFREWTDAAGTKKINAKILDFQENDLVRIQLAEGKTMTTLITNFSDADQETMKSIRSKMLKSEGVRLWTDSTGTRTFTARFVDFSDEKTARFQLQSGKNAAVPIQQLSQADQEFLRKEN